MNKPLSDPIAHSALRSCLGLSSALLITLASAQINAPVERKPLADSVLPGLIQSRTLSTVPANEIVQFTLSLQPRDPAGLAKYADAVSSPRSPLYGQYLSPKEVGDRFGASAKNRSDITSYLQSKGLQSVLVAPNGLAIIAEGPASRVSAALGTQLAYFQGTDGFSKRTFTYRANLTAVTLPSPLVQIVGGISGLETFSRPQPRATMLTPAQTAGLYKLQPARSLAFNGDGRHIAISNFDGFKLSNVPLFTSKFALPLPAKGSGSNISVVTVGTGAQNGVAQGEGDLDIQMVLGMAPLASIRVYDSKTDLIGVLARESSDNWAEVVTESYGWSLSNATAQAAHNLHLAMTAQGITYAAASGDTGTNVYPYSYPDYEPEVLQVGGTIADVNVTTNARTTEVGWAGSGGGWVANTLPFNILPTWQKGNGVPTNVNRRLVPDIALHSAGTGGKAGAYYVYYNGALYGFLGTSCAAPIFAGSLAVVEQRLVANGKAGKWGRLQDFIYSQNGKSDIYFDILTGSNGKLPLNATSTALTGPVSNAKAGWDFVTGWGALNFDTFYTSLLNKAKP